MTRTPFSPQLIGETEKTLNAVLKRTLDGRLTEPEWVTLRIASQPEADVRSGAELAARVAERAQFEEATSLVEVLTAAGLLADGCPTEKGRSLLAELQARVAANAGPIFDGLPADDLAAAGRVLTVVRDRAKELLAR
jgi:hypothetical protein